MFHSHSGQRGGGKKKRNYMTRNCRNGRFTIGVLFPWQKQSSVQRPARCGAALTDSRTRLQVPFKKGYFLPPCDFLVNTK